MSNSTLSPKSAPRYAEVVYFERGRYIWINKPADVVMDGSSTVTANSIADYMYKQQVLASRSTVSSTDGTDSMDVDGSDDIHVPRLQFCHQLDYATSGIVCFAASKLAIRHAADCFMKRTSRKLYLALVYGHLPIDQTLLMDWPLEQDPTNDFRQLIGTSDLPGKSTVTYCRPIEIGYHRDDPITKVLLYPHSGRRHQLRMHLRNIGHPIVGDKFYAEDAARNCERMMLHALQLTLPIVTGTISASTNDPFEKYISSTPSSSSSSSSSSTPAAESSSLSITSDSKLPPSPCPPYLKSRTGGALIYSWYNEEVHILLCRRSNYFRISTSSIKHKKRGQHKRQKIATGHQEASGNSKEKKDQKKRSLAAMTRWVMGKGNCWCLCSDLPLPTDVRLDTAGVTANTMMRLTTFDGSVPMTGSETDENIQKHLNQRDHFRLNLARLLRRPQPKTGVKCVHLASKEDDPLFPQVGLLVPMPFRPAKEIFRLPESAKEEEAKLKKRLKKGITKPPRKQNLNDFHINSLCWVPLSTLLQPIPETAAPQSKTPHQSAANEKATTTSESHKSASDQKQEAEQQPILSWHRWRKDHLMVRIQPCPDEVLGPVSVAESHVGQERLTHMDAKTISSQQKIYPDGSTLLELSSFLSLMITNPASRTFLEELALKSADDIKQYEMSSSLEQSDADTLQLPQPRHANVQVALDRHELNSLPTESFLSSCVDQSCYVAL